MYLIRNKTKDNIKTPLIFNIEDNKKKKLIDLSNLEPKPTYIYCYVRNLIDDVLNDRTRNYIWEGKVFKLYFFYGIMLYKTSFYYNPNFVAIIYKNKKTKETEAYVNKDYIDYIPSHKTLINKFIKGYGIKHRKNVHYISEKEFNMFLGKINMTPEDYEEKNQIDTSKKFLTFEKWKNTKILS